MIQLSSIIENLNSLWGFYLNNVLISKNWLSGVACSKFLGWEEKKALKVAKSHFFDKFKLKFPLINSNKKLILADKISRSTSPNNLKNILFQKIKDNIFVGTHVILFILNLEMFFPPNSI
jgi:hypothetical protein